MRRVPAGNASTQGSEPPTCCVLPPDDTATAANGFDSQGFEAKAPALKSTNANLWEAWHLTFRPALKGGGFGEYDSADLAQARYMFQKLSGLGVRRPLVSDFPTGLRSSHRSCVCEGVLLHHG